MAWVSWRIVMQVAYFGSGGDVVVEDCDCDDIVVEDVDCWYWDDDDVAAWVDDSMIICFCSSYDFYCCFVRLLISLDETRIRRTEDWAG